MLFSCVPPSTVNLAFIKQTEKKKEEIKITSNKRVKYDMKIRYNKTEKKVPILLKYNKLTPKKLINFN